MKRTLLILALISFGSSYSEALRAKPVLFIEHGLAKRSIEAQEKNDNEVVRQKMLIIINDLIKKYDACAVWIYKEPHHEIIIQIDPAYDITKEAFDRLNKEYLESKTR